MSQVRNHICDIWNDLLLTCSTRLVSALDEFSSIAVLFLSPSNQLETVYVASAFPFSQSLLVSMRIAQNGSVLPMITWRFHHIITLLRNAEPVSSEGTHCRSWCSTHIPWMLPYRSIALRRKSGLTCSNSAPTWPSKRGPRLFLPFLVRTCQLYNPTNVLTTRLWGNVLRERGWKTDGKAEIPGRNWYIAHSRGQQQNYHSSQKQHVQLPKSC